MRYEIVGETLPAVICTLEEGETMITEKGAMSEHENGDGFRWRNEENVRQNDVW